MMAILCGIHCLATPFLLIALPLIGTTFWASEDFHLWMLLLVLPTTTLAVLSGCRRHKDRIVAVCAAIGLAILTFSAARESFAASPGDGLEVADAACAAGSEHVGCCPAPVASSTDENAAAAGFNPLSGMALLNLAGGLFLVAGHVRNFRLCRAASCCHGMEESSQ